jgi:preprotein translocase SecE subunit
MKSSQNPVIAYFRSALEEFGKVTWPTKEQAALLTGIVVGVSLVVGLYLGLLDLGLSQGYQALLKALPETPTESSTGTILPQDIDVTTTPADSTDSTDTNSQQ